MEIGVMCLWRRLVVNQEMPERGAYIGVSPFMSRVERERLGFAGRTEVPRKLGPRTADHLLVLELAKLHKILRCIILIFPEIVVLCFIFGLDRI
jgi:hypothetical protein